VLAASVLLLAACGDDDAEEPAATSTTTAPRTQEQAIEAWVSSDRDEQFPGFDGPYAGPCSDTSTEVLCTIPRDDLGSRSIVGIGVAASDWGADLLLVEGDDGWEVVASWGWDLESDAFGPPFSALTAIAEWWAEEDPAVTFVRDCTEPDPAITDQTFVCAELVDAGDDRLTYRTDGHELVLDLQADQSWAVSEP